MTDEEINAAIAEVSGTRLFMIHKPIHDPFGYYRKDGCGYTTLENAWKVPFAIAKTYVCGKPEDIDRVVAEPADHPDYVNDLNAMHDVEQTIRIEQARDWAMWLTDLAAGGTYFPKNYEDLCPIISATARQRAEAFLRLKGLWKE